MLGPGRYDSLCTQVREEAKAQGAIVIIINGERGSGVSCQADLQATLALPDVLEHMARQMRADMARGQL